MIRYAAARKKTRHLTEEERESEAWRGATCAFLSYSPERGAKLSTWLCLKAKYAIDDAERKESVHARRESCHGSEFFSRLVVHGNLEQDDDNGEENEDNENKLSATEKTRRIVAQALATLDERTREIIERVWYCGESQTEIARTFGFSRSWCSRLYRRGMSTMKEKLSALMGMPKE